MTLEEVNKIIRELLKERDVFIAQLQVILDCVDYTSGNCRPNEPVGGVLPAEVIKNARTEIKRIKESFK
jgi:hypothetical protein